MKRIHRELVKAGMERARQHGKRIGRPRVTEQSGFSQRLLDVMKRISLGEISRRRAAKELDIGYATLKRLMDNQALLSLTNVEESLPPIYRPCDSSRNKNAGVLSY